MPGLDELEARIDALAGDFVAGLPARREGLVRAGEAVAAGEPGARGALAELAHKLRGAAGSFGHPALGVLAAGVEDGAATLSREALLAALGRLLAALDAIVASAPPRPPSASAPAVAPAAPSLTAPERTSAPAASTAPRIKLLALDDDETTRRLLTVCLRPATGFETVPAACWTEALERLAAERFDLVVTDWMMPDGDGLGFCRALRDRGGASAAAPLVVLSAAAPPSGLVLGVDRGPVAWIQKPFTPRVLVEELRAIARR